MQQLVEDVLEHREEEQATEADNSRDCRAEEQLARTDVHVAEAPGGSPVSHDCRRGDRRREQSVQEGERPVVAARGWPVGRAHFHHPERRFHSDRMARSMKKWPMSDLVTQIGPSVSLPSRPSFEKTFCELAQAAFRFRGGCSDWGPSWPAFRHSRRRLEGDWTNRETSAIFYQLLSMDQQRRHADCQREDPYSPLYFALVCQALSAPLPRVIISQTVPITTLSVRESRNPICTRCLDKVLFRGFRVVIPRNFSLLKTFDHLLME